MRRELKDTKNKIRQEPYARACNPPILNLCNGVFTDQVILNIIFQHLFPRKWKHLSVYVRISSTIFAKRRGKCFQNIRNTFFYCPVFNA